MLAQRHQHSTTELLREALDFAKDYYLGGHDGKTIVVGFSRNQGPIAFAAGLSTDSQQKRLILMARYLFAKNHVDSYVLIMPAWYESEKGEQEVLAVEVVTAEEKYLSICPLQRNGTGKLTGLESGKLSKAQRPLIEDLLARGQSLPGIMRRELDRAYNLLRLDFPAPRLPA